MTTDGSLENVRQIGFEIHTPELFRAFKMNIPSKKHDYLKMYKTLAKLEEIGFRRYDHRKNPFGEFKSNISGIVRACCYELYYLNMKYYTKHQREIEEEKPVVKLFDDVWLVLFCSVLNSHKFELCLSWCEFFYMENELRES